jgi:hypothetical protein
MRTEPQAQDPTPQPDRLFFTPPDALLLVLLRGIIVVATALTIVIPLAVISTVLADTLLALFLAILTLATAASAVAPGRGILGSVTAGAASALGRRGTALVAEPAVGPEAASVLEVVAHLLHAPVAATATATISTAATAVAATSAAGARGPIMAELAPRAEAPRGGAGQV